MQYTMESYLAAVEPFINPTLIDPVSLANIRQVTQIIPPASSFGFECRLAEDAPRVDLGLRITPTDGRPTRQSSTKCRRA